MAGDGVKTDKRARKAGAWAWMLSTDNAAHWSTPTGILGIVLGSIAALKGLPPETGVLVATGIGAVGGALIRHKPEE